MFVNAKNANVYIWHKQYSSKYAFFNRTVHFLVTVKLSQHFKTNNIDWRGESGSDHLDVIRVLQAVK